MKTFGDYEERCNVPNSSIVQRCGICDDAFNTVEELNEHHIKTREEKYEYHEPVGVAGGLCYSVDAEGYRVNSRGRRY
jgi:hypothetical protein